MANRRRDVEAPRFALATAALSAIGILHPGEMGSAVGSALRAGGHRILIVTAGRSPRTVSRGITAGFTVVPDLAALSDRSDLVISLLPPNGVISVANAYCRAARAVERAAPFVDMNAKTLSDARALSVLFAEAGLEFTNACIIGGAGDIQISGKIFASGTSCGKLETIVGRIIPVQHMGKNVEQATAFKMAFAGFNKTAIAALLETATAAHGLGVFEPLILELRERMPGTMTELGHLLHNYPRHIDRRAGEMRALASLLAEAGLANAMAAGAAFTFDAAKKPLAAVRESDNPDAILAALGDGKLQIPDPSRTGGRVAGSR